jgi:4-amino-4-deoxy-L-arabinose transferase-like glycosyltransferase
MSGRLLDPAALVVATGFIIRLWAASGTYLNPDEAMHFMVANRDSLKLAYQASLNLAHPPLLIFILYFLRGLGTSELLLRFPSIIAGTAFCWIAYKWLGILFDRTTCFVALILLAFLPAMIALSAEVRQYALLLFFNASAGFFLEKSLAKNSASLMVLSALSLYLAMLAHYSAFLFAAALSIYTIFRIIWQHPEKRVFLVWAIAQSGSVGTAVFLYVTHLSKFGLQSSVSASQDQDFYLRNSYFDSSHMNVLHFIFARTGGVFQYIFSQLVIGDLAFLLFIAGIVILCRDKQSRNTQAEKPEINGRVLAILLMLPFALTCAAALLGKYPYGGTRHDALLIPFAIAGVSVALVRILGSQPGRAVIAAILIVGLCNAFPAHRQPYIARADQSSEQMNQAVKFIRTQISPSELIFSDFQSRLLLGHYLCDRKMVSYDKSMPDFISAEYHGLRMIATTAKTFTFTPKTFLLNWNQMIVAFGLKPGEKVWVVQEGWNIRLPDQLKGLQEFHNLSVDSFGHNIAMFQLAVGQTLPNPDSLSN